MSIKTLVGILEKDLNGYWEAENLEYCVIPADTLPGQSEVEFLVPTGLPIPKEMEYLFDPKHPHVLPFEEEILDPDSKSTEVMEGMQISMVSFNLEDLLKVDWEQISEELVSEGYVVDGFVEWLKEQGEGVESPDKVRLLIGFAIDKMELCERLTKLKLL